MHPSEMGNTSGPFAPSRRWADTVLCAHMRVSLPGTSECPSPPRAILTKSRLTRQDRFGKDRQFRKGRHSVRIRGLILACVGVLDEGLQSLHPFDKWRLQIERIGDLKIHEPAPHLFDSDPSIKPNYRRLRSPHSSGNGYPEGSEKLAEWRQSYQDSRARLKSLPAADSPESGSATGKPCWTTPAQERPMMRDDNDR